MKITKSGWSTSRARGKGTGPGARNRLDEPVPEPDPAGPARRPCALDLQRATAAAATRRAEQSALAVRICQRYKQVQALRPVHGIQPIMCQTDPAKEAVRSFYRVASAEEPLAKIRGGRSSLLDEYKPACTSGRTQAVPTSCSCTPSFATAATTAPSAST